MYTQTQPNNNKNIKMLHFFSPWLNKYKKGIYSACRNMWQVINSISLPLLLLTGASQRLPISDSSSGETLILSEWIVLRCDMTEEKISFNCINFSGRYLHIYYSITEKYFHVSPTPAASCVFAAKSALPLHKSGLILVACWELVILHLCLNI